MPELALAPNGQPVGMVTASTLSRTAVTALSTSLPSHSLEQLQSLSELLVVSVEWQELPVTAVETASSCSPQEGLHPPGGSSVGSGGIGAGPKETGAEASSAEETGVEASCEQETGVEASSEQLRASDMLMHAKSVAVATGEVIQVTGAATPTRSSSLEVQRVSTFESPARNENKELCIDTVATSV